MDLCWQSNVPINKGSLGLYCLTIVYKIRLFIFKGFFKIYFLIGGKFFTILCWFLPIQQCESAIIIHISPSLESPPSPLSRSSQNAQLGHLCCKATSHQLSVFTHGSMYRHMSTLLSPFVPLSPVSIVPTSPFSVSASPFLP